LSIGPCARRACNLHGDTVTFAAGGKADVHVFPEPSCVDPLHASVAAIQADTSLAEEKPGRECHLLMRAW
jgi:hypothetical protein